jgi:hypothetical protein
MGVLCAVVLHFVGKVLEVVVVRLIGFAIVANYFYHLFFNREILPDPSPDDPPDEWFQL